MYISDDGVALIKEFEGFRAKAYLDSADVPTIGYGTIRYADGSYVKMGETVTPISALNMLLVDIGRRSAAVSGLLRKPVTQNQFDALLSFVYNLGIGALERSTLLKKVNLNPDDPSIRNEFLRWNKAGGKVVPGLTKRREKEAELYFKK